MNHDSTILVEMISSSIQKECKIKTLCDTIALDICIQDFKFQMLLLCRYKCFLTNIWHEDQTNMEKFNLNGNMPLVGV